jgi:hypothetical protein
LLAARDTKGFVAVMRKLSGRESTRGGFGHAARKKCMISAKAEVE